MLALAAPSGNAITERFGDGKAAMLEGTDVDLTATDKNGMFRTRAGSYGRWSLYISTT